MKSNCVSHLEKEPIIIIRQSYVEFCNGNVVAAALVSFFEYWHNIKLAICIKNKQINDIAEKHGDNRSQDEKLYQFHTNKELQMGILNIGGESKINSSLKELVEMKLITIHKNPNPRYKFDKTNYFLLNDEILQELIDSVKSRNRGIKNTERTGGNTLPSIENTEAITEITTEDKNITTLSIAPGDVIDCYNKTLSGVLPIAQELTSSRLSIIKARTIDRFKTMEEWSLYFQRVRNTRFLSGANNRGWKANFDWIINPSNMVKILEGQYDFANKENQKPSHEEPSSRNPLVIYGFDYGA